MPISVKQKIRNVVNLVIRPERVFHSDEYLRIDKRRLEHLASLGLPLANKRVLEVGAGIGDLTSFFLDRGCTMTTTEGREKNVRIIKQRFPNIEARVQNLEDPNDIVQGEFDIVFAYGVLYHLAKPEIALDLMAKACSGLLLLETRVTYGDELDIHLEDKLALVASQSVSGSGCRPTRAWMMDALRKRFDHVYVPKTQPNHEQFPTDWRPDAETAKNPRTRGIFIASRTPLDNPLLLTELPIEQERH